MSDINASKLDLGSGFAVQTREDWLAKASQSLAGRPVSELCSKTADGIEINAIYDRVAEPLLIPGMPASPPLVMPLVIETEPDAANTAILDELAGGAGGLVLQMTASGQPGIAMEPGALTASLAGVRLDAASLSLALGNIDWAKAPELFAALIDTDGNPPRSIGLGADPIGAGLISKDSITPKTLAPVAQFSATLADISAVTVFSASGVPAHEAGATEAQELATMLASGVAYLRALDAAGHSPQTACRRIGLELSVDADVFVSIAKLRAARLLWLRIDELCGGGHHPNLHVRSSARMMSKAEVHTNMLRTTAACLAAMLGGADSLTVLPFTHALGRPDTMARRIARNQTIILTEEAYIGRVADAASGSGYIEHLTEGLAAKSWALFQQIESAGGAASPAGAEVLHRKVGEARKIRAAQIAAGKCQIVGVNAFVNADDVTPDVVPWPA